MAISSPSSARGRWHRVAQGSRARRDLYNPHCRPAALCARSKKEQGLPEGGIDILPIVETAAGYSNHAAIARSRTRVKRIARCGWIHARLWALPGATTRMNWAFPIARHRIVVAGPRGWSLRLTQCGVESLPRTPTPSNARPAAAPGTSGSRARCAFIRPGAGRKRRLQAHRRRRGRSAARDRGVRRSGSRRSGLDSGRRPLRRLSDRLSRATCHRARRTHRRGGSSRRLAKPALPETPMPAETRLQPLDNIRVIDVSSFSQARFARRSLPNSAPKS